MKIGGAEYRFKRSKLFKKYYLTFSIVVVVCITIAGGMTMLLVSRYWSDERLQSLLNDSNNIAAMTEDYLESGRLSYKNIPESENSILSICSSLDTTSQVTGSDIFICSLSGSVVLCRDMVSDDHSELVSDYCDIHSGYVLDKEIINKLTAERSFFKQTELEGRSGSQFVAGSCVYDSGKLSCYVISVQSVKAGLAGYIMSFFRIILMAMALALIISFITVYILVYNITKPLTEMAIATKKYSQGDFSYRIAVKGENELAELAESLNSMASGLAVLENSRRSFVANVSHELKTPMTSIGGFIDGMRDGTIPPEQQNNYLKIVSDEVKRLTRLITSMLNMSKIEAGELKLKLTDFNLTDMIFTTLLSFEQIISKKNIQIDGLDAVDTIFVKADVDMLNQVLYNLIDNAVKFTPEDGCIFVSAEQNKQRTTVHIRNYGVGIPESERKMIFERFYKIDKSRSFDVKSVGLGLYIVKSILDLHGGGIGVTSEVNKYTEFTFWIPR